MEPDGIQWNLCWGKYWGKALTQTVSASIIGAEVGEYETQNAPRHTFASMCFAAGMPVRVVSELLGHSSVQITMDIYIHLIHENNLLNFPELDTLK